MISDAWEQLEGTDPSPSESSPGRSEKSLPLDLDIRRWEYGDIKAQGLAAGKTLQHILAFRPSIFGRIPVGGK